MAPPQHEELGLYSLMVRKRPGLRVPFRCYTICGFTLIELLVVVAIIAVLIALLLPALTRVRDVTRQVTCSVNQRSFSAAMFLYVEENTGCFPYNLMGDRDECYGELASPRLLMGPNSKSKADSPLLKSFTCPGSRVAGPLENLPIAEYDGDAWAEASLVHHLPFKSVRISYEWDCACWFSIHQGLLPRRISVIEPITPLIWDMAAALAFYYPDDRQVFLISHKGEGGNVTYGDGSVTWKKAPLWLGHSTPPLP